jgi:glycosyltransferase involved in cell wall biosynthesis
MLGRAAARLAGVPAITHHVHGFGFHQFTHPLVKTVYVAFEKIGARCQDFMITVGEQHREIAIELGIEKPERIRTILNGIEVDKFVHAERDSTRRELGYGGQDIVLGSIGRLADQKGFEYLLRALPAVLARHPRVKLAIAGIGPLEEHLKQVAAEVGVQHAVRFLGFRRDAPQLLAAFDIFVHPSLWEGLSISLMEAMAAGRPIVCSRIPGNVEMIVDGHTGIFTEPADPASVAAGLNRMLDDPEAARLMAERSQREAIDRFTVERMIRENIDAYDRTARRGRKQPVPIDSRREGKAA